MFDIESVLKGHGIGVGGGSNIKSVQRGIVSSGTSAPANITISPVDINNSIVLVYDTYYGNPATYNKLQIKVRGRLTATNTITFEVEAGGNGWQTAWQVIEFKNIKSLQKGTASVGNGTVTLATISPVDLTKAIVFFSHTTNDTQPEPVDIILSVYLLDAQTLKCCGFYGATKTINWHVVEFN